MSFDWFENAKKNLASREYRGYPREEEETDTQTAGLIEIHRNSERT
jgi:hypothetical protein